jgi:hypothetical protein
MENTDSQTFDFLGLAPDLRNRIYEEVYHDDAPAEIALSKVGRHIPVPALVRTCHQIRHEALGYLLQAQQNLRSRKYHVSITAQELKDHDGHDMPRLSSLIDHLEIQSLPTFHLRIQGLKGCPHDKALIIELDATTSEHWFAWFPWNNQRVDPRQMSTDDRQKRLVRAFVIESVKMGFKSTTTTPGGQLDVEKCLRVLQKWLRCLGADFVERCER